MANGYNRPVRVPVRVNVAALVFLAAVTASTAESPAVKLLHDIAQKVRQNKEGLPNYTCVQNITRAQFAPLAPSRQGGTCDVVLAARKENGRPGFKVMQDRVRLDVAVVDNREMFAWAGARQFETSEIDTMIQGTSGSGDFGSFLVAAFARGVERYTYKGEEDIDIGRMAKFLYAVPVEKSGYRMRIGKLYETMGYHGTFYADPKDADIRRLVVEATEFPERAGVCRVLDTMDYRRVKMGDHDFLLPEVTSMEVIYRSGQESYNETRYSGCKQYVGTSTIRFDDVDDVKVTEDDKKEAQIPLAPKTRLTVRLEGNVDLYRASAGDTITAVVEKDVLREKKVVVRANSKLHGRLVRVEQDFPQPFPHWVIGIKFETIERAGQEQPIRLEAMDDGLRAREPQTYSRVRSQSNTLPLNALPRHEKNSAMGLFIFATAENPKLDRSFRSEWQVVSAPPAKPTTPTP